MAITNLLGTTWRVPVGWSAVAGYGVFYVDYEARLQIASNYTVQFYNGAQIGIGCTTNNAATQNIADRIYFSTSNSTHSIKPPAGNIRSITFWGGADLTNPDLISWLEEYGELVSIKKFTRIYSGAVAYSNGGKCFRKLQNTEYVEESTDSIIGTWYFNKTISSADFSPPGISFVCGTTTCTDMGKLVKITGETGIFLVYRLSASSVAHAYNFTTNTWENEIYRTVTFSTESASEEFIAWLRANAVKQ